MDPPGMSLFQGAGSIHINNSAQDRLEEQEEIEDQKRREQELHQNLRTAFDDLHDDEEASSVDTSANFTLDNEHGNGDNGVNDKHLKHPPTYLESQHHFQDHHKHDFKSSTPLHPHHIMRINEEKLAMTPYGAGDGQNHCVVHVQRDGHTNGIHDFGIKQELANYEQLKVMYNLRVQEVEKLTAQNMELKAMTEKEENSLRARLTAAVTDKEKTELSLKQSQQLLATTKHAMDELTQELDAVNLKLQNKEQEKKQIKLQLGAANHSLQQLQQQLYNLQLSRNQNTDTLFRETLDKHREETDRLHNDLQREKQRLEEKEMEIKVLEKRCQEKDRERDELVIEKSSTVNRLLSELEATQSRLVSGETNKLKDKLATVTGERNAAKEQVKELGSKLEVTAHELMCCRNKLSVLQKDFDTWQTNLKQIVMESLPDTYKGDPHSPGKLSTLKDLLGRYKQIANKVSTLQDDINKRDKKLEHHRKQESELKSQLDEYKGIEAKLQSRVAVLQNKLELLGTNGDADLLESYKTENEQLTNQLDSLRREMKDLSLKFAEMELQHEKVTSEKTSRADVVQGANHDLIQELHRCGEMLREKTVQNGDLNTLYLQACSARDAITRELRETQSRLQREKENFRQQEQELIERMEREKRTVEKLTAELNSAKEELQRANERISELQKEFNEQHKEVNSKLNQYLEEEKQSKRNKDVDKSCAYCEKHLKTIRNLEEQLNKCTLRLATQESNEELMNELRSKAEFFSEYIVEKYKKAQECRHVATNTECGDPVLPVDTHRAQTQHNGLASSDDDLGEKTKLMLKEREIRQQIAEKFTLEIKTIELQCAKRIKEAENEQLNTITKLKELVEKKAHEVEMLKEFILTERSKVSHILQAKENEFSELLKDHNSLAKDFQTLKDKTGEVKIKLEKYQERVKYVEEKYRNEKENWKRSASEYEKERQSVNNKLAQLDAEYQLLKTKYKNAKKTAFAYKDYINKKDDHVNSELSRIKNEYMEIFVRLDTQLNHLRNVRIKQVVNGGETHSNTDLANCNYAEMIKRLQNDITALAESKYQGDD